MFLLLFLISFTAAASFFRQKDYGFSSEEFTSQRETHEKTTGLSDREVNRLGFEKKYEGSLKLEVDNPRSSWSPEPNYEKKYLEHQSEPEELKKKQPRNPRRDLEKPTKKAYLHRHNKSYKPEEKRDQYLKPREHEYEEHKYKHYSLHGPPKPECEKPGHKLRPHYGQKPQHDNKQCSHDHSKHEPDHHDHRKPLHSKPEHKYPPQHPAKRIEVPVKTPYPRFIVKMPPPKIMVVCQDPPKQLSIKAPPPPALMLKPVSQPTIIVNPPPRQKVFIRPAPPIRILIKGLQLPRLLVKTPPPPKVIVRDPLPPHIILPKPLDPQVEFEPYSDSQPPLHIIPPDPHDHYEGNHHDPHRYQHQDYRHEVDYHNCHPYPDGYPGHKQDPQYGDCHHYNYRNHGNQHPCPYQHDYQHQPCQQPQYQEPEGNSGRDKQCGWPKSGGQSGRWEPNWERDKSWDYGPNSRGHEQNRYPPYRNSRNDKETLDQTPIRQEEGPRKPWKQLGQWEPHDNSWKGDYSGHGRVNLQDDEESRSFSNPSSWDDKEKASQIPMGPSGWPMNDQRSQYGNKNLRDEENSLYGGETPDWKTKNEYGQRNPMEWDPEARSPENRNRPREE